VEIYAVKITYSMLVAELVESMSSKPQNKYQPYNAPKKMKTLRMVPMQIDASEEHSQRRFAAGTSDSSFGQRRRGYSERGHRPTGNVNMEGGTEISWIPSSGKSSEEPDQKDKRGKSGEGKEKPFTLGRGADPDQDKREIADSERKGRTKRRSGMRSGSRSIFRRT
jgi:ribosome biogenesis protein ENP2